MTVARQPFEEPCAILQDLLVEYLNAVAVEQRTRNDEDRAFAQVALEVAQAKTRHAIRVREDLRRRLTEHCNDHHCWPAEEIIEITEASHRRAKGGHRMR